MLNAEEPGRMMLPLSHQSENAFCIFGVAKEVATTTPPTSENFLAFLMVAGSTRSLRLLAATLAERARLPLA